MKKRVRMARRRSVDIASALLPLERASQLLGLNLGGTVGRMYTWLLFLSFIAIIYGSSMYLKSKSHLNEVETFVLWIQYAGNTLLVFVVVGTCVLRPRQFTFPLHHMDSIDAELRSFGVRFKNDHLLTAQIVQIVSSAVIPIAFGFTDILTTIHSKSFSSFLYWLHYDYAVVICIITDCLFSNYLDLIEKRFRRLNALVRNIDEERLPLRISHLGADEREGFWKENNKVLYRTQKLRQIHHDLCSLSMKVNINFGFVQLVNSSISLVMITGTLYEAYHAAMKGWSRVESTIYNILWTAFYIGRLMYVSYACSRTSNQANLTATILHEMPIEDKTRSVKDEVQLFSLQLIHESLTFTALGFFPIDVTVLCPIVQAVTTYLVILIQMDTSGTNRAGRSTPENIITTPSPLLSNTMI